MSEEFRKIPVCTFKVTFRERDQFYKVIKWLNANVGQGKQFWSIEGRVLKHLNRNRSVTSNVHVYKEGFGEENALFLTLL